MALKSSWRVFWGRSANFDSFSIFGEVNFHFPEFSGVFGEKRRRVSYWDILSYRKPFLMKFWSILGLFDLLEPLEQVSEPLEVIAGDFSSGKLSGPSGPFQCWSCWRLGAAIFGDSKAMFSYFGPSESDGRGFRTIWGHLHHEMLHARLKGHQGHLGKVLYKVHFHCLVIGKEHVQLIPIFWFCIYSQICLLRHSYSCISIWSIFNTRGQA